MVCVSTVLPSTRISCLTFSSQPPNLSSLAGPHIDRVSVQSFSLPPARILQGLGGGQVKPGGEQLWPSRMVATFSDTSRPANGQLGSLALTEVISKIAPLPQRSLG